MKEELTDDHKGLH